MPVRSPARSSTSSSGRIRPEGGPRQRGFAALSPDLVRRERLGGARTGRPRVGSASRESGALVTAHQARRIRRADDLRLFATAWIAGFVFFYLFIG